MRRPRHAVDWYPKPERKVEAIQSVIAGLQAADIGAAALQVEIVEVAQDAENDCKG